MPTVPPAGGDDAAEAYSKQGVSLPNNWSDAGVVSLYLPKPTEMSRMILRLRVPTMGWMAMVLSVVVKVKLEI